MEVAIYEPLFKTIQTNTNRNRTKRRLRAAVREVFPQAALSGVDYVLIGRYNTATCDFQKLKANMQNALEQINIQLKTKKASK